MADSESQARLQVSIPSLNPPYDSLVLTRRSACPWYRKSRRNASWGCQLSRPLVCFLTVHLIFIDLIAVSSAATLMHGHIDPALHAQSMAMPPMHPHPHPHAPPLMPPPHHPHPGFIEPAAQAEEVMNGTSCRQIASLINAHSVNVRV